MSILDQAAEVIKDRQTKYGDPKDFWDAVADAWTSWLRLKGALKDGEAITGMDATVLMNIMKQYRHARGYHEDTARDTIGYAVVTSRCANGS